MQVFVRLSHHRHTGRLRPHAETSYALLAFVLVLTALVLVGVGGVSNASSTTGGGAYTVQAVVPGPRPTTPATITSPSNGQTFQTNPVTVSGTCPPKTLVEIDSNGILIGTILCPANGHFSIPVTLVTGANALTALAYNTNNQAGPSSPTVNVTLVAPAGGPGFSTELLLQSVNYYRGSAPGEVVTWPITIVGGVAPYAVSFDWGDGTSDLVTRTSAGPFTLTHTYKKAGGYLGSYPLIIRASDAAGHTAYLQLTTIVNDPSAATGTVTKTKTTIMYLLVWPIWVVLILMLISFWLGERREKRVLRRKLEAAAV